MKGQNFLKVTGILMIIFGAIAIIVSIVALVGVAAVAALAAYSGAEVSTGLLYFASFISLLSAVAEFVAGILGVANCKKPEKAQTCLVFGIIVAALCVLGNILTVVGGGSFSVFSLLLGLVIPVLYIIGAVFNKQSLAQAQLEG